MTKKSWEIKRAKIKVNKTLGFDELLPSRVTGGADRLLIRPEFFCCWVGVEEEVVEDDEVSLVVTPLEEVVVELFLSEAAVEAAVLALFLILLDLKWSVPLAIVLILNRLPPVAKLLFLLPRLGLFLAGEEEDEFMTGKSRTAQGVQSQSTVVSD